MLNGNSGCPFAYVAQQARAVLPGRMIMQWCCKGNNKQREKADNREQAHEMLAAMTNGENHFVFVKLYATQLIDVTFEVTDSRFLSATRVPVSRFKPQIKS